MAIEYPIKKSLGADVRNFPKAQQDKIKEIIDTVNDLTDGSISTTDLTLSGNLSVNTIVEKTLASGVNVDGVLIKDSTIALADGLVSDLSLKIGADLNNGLYGVSDTQLGIAVEGVLVGGANVNGLFTGNISEQVSTVGVTVDGALLKDGLHITKAVPVAINATATATAAEIVSGYITSTSAAVVTITTPTAASIAELIGAVKGTSFDFTIDNSAGANTVTLALDASIAVVTPAITGGATLTVSTANALGVFRIIFTSGTTAKIFRIA